MKKYLALLPMVFSTISVFTQNKNTVTDGLIPYSPEYSLYTVYYPNGYETTYETDVIKFTEPKEDGITISPYSYLIKKDITDADLILMLSVTYEINEADFRSIPSKFNNLVVGTGFSNNKYRIIYSGILNRRMVVVSISKRSNFTEQEMQLLERAMTNLKIQ